MSVIRQKTNLVRFVVESQNNIFWSSQRFPHHKLRFYSYNSDYQSFLSMPEQKAMITNSFKKTDIDFRKDKACVKTYVTLLYSNFDFK